MPEIVNTNISIFYVLLNLSDIFSIESLKKIIETNVFSNYGWPKENKSIQSTRSTKHNEVLNLEKLHWLFLICQRWRNLYQFHEYCQ